jgi:hypothetical protein
MSSRLGVRTGAVIAVGAVLLLSVGCGGQSSAKSTATSGSSSAKPSRSFNSAQLEAALLTDADVPRTTINQKEENTEATTSEEDKITTGGASCQKFVDATEQLVPTYGTTAAVSRDLLGVTDTDVRYDLTLASLPGSSAKQVTADIRAGLAACTGVYTYSQGSDTLSISDKEIRISPVGDSAIAYLEQSQDSLSGNASSNPMYYEFVQVGSAIVEVTVYPMQSGPNDPQTLQGKLASAVKAQVARLEAA